MGSESQDANEHIAQAIHASCTPREFEGLVATLYEREGYRTEMKGRGSDDGTDILATQGGRTTAIQVKRYSIDNKIGSPEVRDAIGSAHQHGADHIAVVTTSLFTGPAKDVARDLGADEMDIELIDGVELVSRLDDGNVSVSDTGEIVTGADARASDGDLVSELVRHLETEVETEAKQLQHELITHIRREIEEEYKDEIIEKAKELGEDVARRIKEEDFSDRMTAVRGRAGTLRDGAADGRQAAAERASSSAEAAREKAEAAGDHVQERAADAKERASETGEKAKEKASDLRDRLL
jgi:vacuolar-type H+-ATPase subunit H